MMFSEAIGHIEKAPIATINSLKSVVEKIRKSSASGEEKFRYQVAIWRIGVLRFSRFGNSWGGYARQQLVDLFLNCDVAGDRLADLFDQIGELPNHFPPTAIVEMFVVIDLYFFDFADMRVEANWREYLNGMSQIAQWKPQIESTRESMIRKLHSLSRSTNVAMRTLPLLDPCLPGGERQSRDKKAILLLDHRHKIGDLDSIELLLSPETLRSHHELIDVLKTLLGVEIPPDVKTEFIDEVGRSIKANAQGSRYVLMELWRSLLDNPRVMVSPPQ